MITGVLVAWLAPYPCLADRCLAETSASSTLARLSSLLISPSDASSLCNGDLSGTDSVLRLWGECDLL